MNNFINSWLRPDIQAINAYHVQKLILVDGFQLSAALRLSQFQNHHSNQPLDNSNG
jgi:hypothetical protein